MLMLDDALMGQPRLAAGVAARDGRRVEAGDLGPAMRLWTREGVLAALRDRLDQQLGRGSDPELVFAGSGDFHHVTPLLLERALARAGGAVTVLHFDNHPDWVRAAMGRHCGSWVGRAARLPGVERVVSIGVCSGDVGRQRRGRGDLALVEAGRLDLFAWEPPDGGDELVIGSRAWPAIAALGECGFIRALEACIRTPCLYVTIDKDVLAPAEAATNWDQGRASLAFLENVVRAAAAGRRLVGADVVGDWSPPRYGGGRLEQAAKRAEAWLDQPRTPPGASVLAANEVANLRLLHLFAEAAA